MLIKRFIFLMFFAYVLFSSDDLVNLKKASQIYVFKNTYVFDTEVDKDEILGNIFYETTLFSLKSMKRFNLKDKTTISKDLLRLGFGHANINDRENIIRMAESLGIDSFILPMIKRDGAKINLEIRLLDRSGTIFAFEKIEDFVYKNNYHLKLTYTNLVEKLIDRIPYSGLIRRIEKDLFELDVGIKDGFKQNDVVSIFEITDVEKHPVLEYVVDLKKETIGRLLLLKVEATRSFAKLRSIKPGEEFRVNMKIGKMAIPKDPFVYPEPKKLYQKSAQNYRYQSNLGYLEFRPSIGQFSYVLTSDNSDYNQSIKSFYPRFEALLDLWLTSKWVFFTSVEAGVVPLKSSTLNPSAINALVSRFEALIKYRFILGEGLSDPQILPLFGFYRFGFLPDHTTPIRLTKMTYYGLSLGVEMVVPVNLSYTMFGKFIYHPMAQLKESPEKSGTSSSSRGYQVDIGLCKKYNDRISFTGGGNVTYYSSSFKGASSRGTPNAENSLTSTSVYGGVRLEL